MGMKQSQSFIQCRVAVLAACPLPVTFRHVVGCTETEQAGDELVFVLHVPAAILDSRAHAPSTKR